MATSEKNILITPNIGQTADPTIVFSGASVTANAANITATILPTSNGTLAFSGTAGQLFSITNSLTGTLFSVNDISGIPSMEILDTGTIKLAQYSGNIGIGTANPTGKLDIGSGNLTFSNTTTGQRITGDFSNATIANRLMFQTSTVNNGTGIIAIPNGTGTSAVWRAANSSNVANCSTVEISATSTDARLVSSIYGTGSYLPLTFYTGNSERMRIDSTGNVAIGTTTTSWKTIISDNTSGTFGSLYLGKTIASLLTGTNGGGAIYFGGNPNTGANEPTAAIETSWQGSTNPSLAIGVIRDSVKSNMLFDYANNTFFRTGTTTNMRIHSSGGVSIGNNTDPGATNLSVTGTITTGGNAVLSVAGNQTIAARTIQQGSQSSGTMLTASGSLGGLEIQSAGSGNAAFMTFHKPGNWASYFGVDTDNQFAVGGWSAGAALANFKAGSLGIGTAASGTAGEIRATNAVTAFYSDIRLKENIKPIENALDKVNSISGVTYNSNQLAETFGYTDKSEQVGVLAQELEKVLPHVVKLAPFDTKYIDGKEVSVSGENYKTIQYERIIPLLVEAIKELNEKVKKLEGK